MDQITAIVLQEEFDSLDSRIVDFEVNNDTIYEAAEFKKALAQFKKRVVVAEVQATGNIKIELEKLTAPFLAMRKKIDETNKLLADRILKYHEVEDKKRIEAARKEKELQTKALENQQKVFEQDGDIDSVMALESAISHVEKQELTGLKSIKTGFATLSFGKKWTFSVDKIELVPIELLTVDEEKVMALIGTGSRNIPGLNIFQKTTSSVR